jgi:hypothetical protein
MAKLKLKKYPKKPKASASLATKERYLDKCKSIDAENKVKFKDQEKSKSLDKKIAGLSKK